MSKKEKTTLQIYKAKKREKLALSIGKYGLCAVPMAVVTGVNWNDWFSQTKGSLPFGFCTLLVALLTTVYAISKKDNEKEEKVSSMYFICALLCIWGVSFLLLANIMYTMGEMLLFTALGVLTGATCDQINMSYMNASIDEYKRLVEDNCLDKKSIAKAERKEKAQREREEKAKAEATDDGRSI